MAPNSEEIIDFAALNKLGFPTFDEFKKNPDKWRKATDELFKSCDASMQLAQIRGRMKTQKYSWRDKYFCESLEQLERIAKEEGYSAEDLEMIPIVKTIDGSSQYGRVEIVVQFWPRDEYVKKGRVPTNSTG